MCYIVKLPRFGKDGRVVYSSASSAASSTNTLQQESQLTPPPSPVKKTVFANRPNKRPPRYFCLFHGCFFACPKKLELERHVEQAHTDLRTVTQATTKPQKKRKRVNASESPQEDSVAKRQSMQRRQTTIC